MALARRGVVGGLAVAAVVAAFFAIQYRVASSKEARQCPELVSYNPAHARADAVGALDRQERYLLAVRGYTVWVPEPGDRAESLAARRAARRGSDLPVRIIEGTSDSRCRSLNERTAEYARRFNEAMQAARR